jgi:hypothetical protein
VGQPARAVWNCLHGLRDDGVQGDGALAMRHERRSWPELWAVGPTCPIVRTWQLTRARE